LRFELFAFHRVIMLLVRGLHVFTCVDCLNATKSFYTQLSLRIGLIVAHIDVLDTRPNSLWDPQKKSGSIATLEIILLIYA
jgi:hypothetical protein